MSRPDEPAVVFEPIDAVTFDLDGTLCRYERSPGEVLDLSFEAVGVEPVFSEAEYSAAYDRFAAEGIGMNELRERCFRWLCERADHDPALGTDLAAAFAAERNHRRVGALPGAREAIEAAREVGPVALVTNGPPDMQREKLAGVGFDGAFDHLTFAGFETRAKPDPEPFDRALDALSIPPERALHVGDSPETDVAGASAAGMRSALVGKRSDGEPTHRIDSLSALPGLLERPQRRI